MTAKRKPSDALRGIRRAEPDRPFDEMTAAQAPRPPMPDIAAEIEKLPFTVHDDGAVYWKTNNTDPPRPSYVQMWQLLQRLAAAQKGAK